MSAPADGVAGKLAFVTGGGAGIGKAIAAEWARRGGEVVVSDRDGAAATAVRDEIVSLGGAAWDIELDVTSRIEIDDAFARLGAANRLVDALFNVAGTNLPKTVEEISDEEWTTQIETNLTSVYRCSKHVIPGMRRRGGGAIVNVASIAGIMGEKRCSAYSASKGGVVLLTRNMAMDLATANIRVNAICPGSTRTPRIESYWRRAGRPGIADCPMKRYAEPDEIAKPAVFLASSDASYITGASLVVDGGLTAGFKVSALDEI